MRDLIKKELEEAAEVLEKFMSQESTLERIEAAAKLMYQSVQQGGTLFSCGNGGSACDAMHFAEELTGKFRDEREPIAAIAISDPAYLTCTSNDYGYGHVFSRYVKALGKKGDVLLAISTSGNSENVLKAAEAARQRGMLLVGLTGKNGGALAELCDVHLNVPHFGYSDRIQEVHIKIIHILIFMIEKYLSVNAGENLR
ncbi:MAG: D-sedoheptulose 7-phosphate isomerase [Cytophagaceae bacterium]|jgi:D-sedoheptulose 7-phosphate isomerase|nr:D-sedoheptulose 7-phosphate isomerase [Cytophagaceae bacterium]